MMSFGVAAKVAANHINGFVSDWNPKAHVQVNPLRLNSKIRPKTTH